jgi:hypothetical protein
MPHFKPPNIRNPDITFKVASDLKTTNSRLARRQQPPRSLQPLPGGFNPRSLGPIAYTPSRSQQPTEAPPSINDPVLNGSTARRRPFGPIHNASLRPRRLICQFRPTEPRVDAPTLRHCAADVLIQVDADLFVSHYDLPTVGVLPQPCRGLGHAIAAPGAKSSQSTHISFHANMCIKAS